MPPAKEFSIKFGGYGRFMSRAPTAAALVRSERHATRNDRAKKSRFLFRLDRTQFFSGWGKSGLLKKLIEFCLPKGRLARA